MTASPALLRRYQYRCRSPPEKSPKGLSCLRRRLPVGVRKPSLRVVVTGGAGFVGSHPVDKLLARPHSVIIVDIRQLLHGPQGQRRGPPRQPAIRAHLVRRSRANPPRGVRSCYNEGKRTEETLTMDYHRGAGAKVRIARIFNSYV
ncbi:unnamed protein product [Urochloa humidicola]